MITILLVNRRATDSCKLSQETHDLGVTNWVSVSWYILEESIAVKIQEGISMIKLLSREGRGDEKIESNLPRVSSTEAIEREGVSTLVGIRPQTLTLNKQHFPASGSAVVVVLSKRSVVLVVWGWWLRVGEH